MSDGRVIRRRDRRLLAYLRYNRDQLIVDTAVVLVWIVASGALFRWFSLPQWLHYLVLFVGIYVYAVVTDDWTRPYESPD